MAQMARIELRFMNERGSAQFFKTDIVGVVYIKQVFSPTEPTLPIWLGLCQQPALEDLSTRIGWEILSLEGDANGQLNREPAYDPKTQKIFLKGLERMPIIPQL